MVFLTEEDKNFIKAKLPDAEQVLASYDVNDVLDSIADWISINGFAPPHYYDYNDLGREAQRVHDRIFRNN